MTALKKHVAMIASTTSHLEARLRVIDQKLRTLSDQVRIPGDGSMERRRLEEERASTQRCLSICADALKTIIDKTKELAISSRSEDPNKFQRQQDSKNDIISGSLVDAHGLTQVGTVRINVFQDIVAASDSSQVIAAAPGDLISAVRITAKAGATQWIGQLSDVTLKTFLQNRQADRSAEQQDEEAEDL